MIRTMRSTSSRATVTCSPRCKSRTMASPRADSSGARMMATRAHRLRLPELRSQGGRLETAIDAKAGLPRALGDRILSPFCCSDWRATKTSRVRSPSGSSPSRWRTTACGRASRVDRSRASPARAESGPEPSICPPGDCNKKPLPPSLVAGVGLSAPDRRLIVGNARRFQQPICHRAVVMMGPVLWNGHG